MTEPNTGRLLPFTRSAEYLRDLGIRRLAKGDPLQALEMLRLSHARAPEDAAVLARMAEAYAAMQCHALSCRKLFAAASLPDAPAETLYFMACSLCDLQAGRAALDALARYAERAPEGEWAAEASELEAHLLECEPERTVYRARRVERALRALEEDKPALAARLLHGETKDAGAMSLLAMARLSSGEAQAALSTARLAVRRNRRSPQARCALAAALSDLGSRGAAERQLRRALELCAADEDARWLVAQTACRARLHALARETLLALEPRAPLSDALLHPLACALWNTGDAEGARRRWRLLLRVDPQDAVAAYWLRASESAAPPREVAYARQLPLSEVLTCLKALREAVQGGHDALLARWRADGELESLARWGLSCEEPGVARAMLGLLSSIGDARAREILCETLADTERTDAFKRQTLLALGWMGAEGPFYALLGGRLATATVTRARADRAASRTQRVAAAVRRLGGADAETILRLRALCGAAEACADEDPEFQTDAVLLALSTACGTPAPKTSRRLARAARRLLQICQEEHEHAPD